MAIIDAIVGVNVTGMPQLLHVTGVAAPDVSAHAATDVAAHAAIAMPPVAYPAAPAAAASPAHRPPTTVPSNAPTAVPSNAPAAGWRRIAQAPKAFAALPVQRRTATAKRRAATANCTSVNWGTP